MKQWCDSIHLLPQFCKTVTSIFQLDLMNLFVKAWAWFNPIIQGMAILIANTSTTSHRDEWLGHTLSLCTENVIMKLRCPKKHHFLVNHALGTMFNYFVLFLSQPTLRREGDAWLAGCVFHERNTRGVATNVYLRKTSEKPEKTRSTNF